MHCPILVRHSTPQAWVGGGCAGTTTSRDMYKQWELEPRKAPPARPMPESAAFEGESEAHAQFREMALEPRRERPAPAIPVSLKFEGARTPWELQLRDEDLSISAS